MFLTTKEALKRSFIMAIRSKPEEWIHGDFPTYCSSERLIKKKAEGTVGSRLKFSLFGCTIYPFGTGAGAESYGLLTKIEFDKIAKALDVFNATEEKIENEKQAIQGSMNLQTSH